MPITNAQIAEQVTDLIDFFTGREEEFQAWLSGAAGGGEASDGKFPLTDLIGTIRLTKSPAQLEADVSGLVGSASTSATAAAASASAASTSASSASTSASTATTQASNASSSASSASGSASAASTSAATALAQQITATAAAAAAAASASAALAASGGVTDPGFDAVMTWNNTTNLPVWSALAGFGLLSANQVWAGTQTVNGKVILSSSAGAGFLQVSDTAATTDEKHYCLQSSSGHFYGFVLDDALGGPVTWLDVNRIGMTVNSIGLTAGVIDITGGANFHYPRISILDPSGSASALTSYVSLQDAAAVERGWMGFGSGTTELRITNSIGSISLNSAGTINLSGVASYADDAAAAIGGVPVGGVYRTASALKIRVS